MKHPFTRIRANKAAKNQLPIIESSKKPSFAVSIALLVIASIAMLGSSGYYWYTSVLTNPDRILSDMLDKSLQTTSVQRTISQENNQTNVEQDIFLAFTPEVYARSLTNLEETSSIGVSKVTTETIGTADTDYVRYNSIDVATRQNTAKQNFDNVLNVWGKREGNPETGQSTSFLNDALFVAVPFGNLNTEQRKELKAEIAKTQLYTIRETKTEFIDARPVITYTMDIKPQALITVLAKYVELTGVGSSAQLDPAQYEGAPSTPIKIQVDLLSRHVNEVSFDSSGRTEFYGAYGGVRDTQYPTETIDVDELQTRLTEVEQKQTQPQQGQQ